ncbi:hypothetical protein J4Q44_G00172850 [Coregonus suidteri]|uniref:SRCN1 inhibitor n=1 Tax=Coregonus suidteri TaxID=861788 RepID=A0AAN8LVR9_9TELE
MMLVKNEGLYADPYSLVHEGRLSIASTQSLAAIGDPFGFPVSGGLYRRGSVRSLSTYSAAALQGELEDALYKPGGPVYSDSYSSATLGMGFRMPPSSPQKIPDMQLRDRGDSYSSSPSRASPVRQTFRKDSTSSSMPGPGGDGSRFAPGYSSPLPGETSESRDRMERLDRMEAMEKQIASLTGLVQSVLTKAPDSDSTCGLLRLCMMAGCPPDQGSEFSRPFPFSSSEKTESNSDGSATGTRVFPCFSLRPSAPGARPPLPPETPRHPLLPGAKSSPPDRSRMPLTCANKSPSSQDQLSRASLDCSGLQWKQGSSECTSSILASHSQGGNSSSAVGKVHSSAASRLKHLQQSSTEKTKTGKREDFLKGQQQ